MMRGLCGAAAVAVALLACGDDPTGIGVVPARLDIEPGGLQTLTAFGQSVQLAAVVRDVHSRTVSGADIAWESRDADAATVDATGLVTARGDGATYVLARSDELVDSVRVVVARPVTPFSIEIASGDGQSGDVGDEFGEPLVVRVLNARGEPVVGHRVLWSVPAADGLLDGRAVHACHGPAPLPVLTDAEGLSRVNFTPTASGSLEVSAHLSAEPGVPVTFSSTVTDALSLTVVSGTRREARAGEDITDLATGGMLKALVTGSAGDPVTGVPVTWRLTAGHGRMAPVYDDCEFDAAPHAVMRSGPEGHGIGEPSGEYHMHGLSMLNVLPLAIGTIQIVASVGGPDAPLDPPLLVFEIDVTGMLLSLSPTYTGETRFFGPDPIAGLIAPLGSVRVPVGTAVEWLNHMPTARITSTSTPPGGSAFDSGVLSARDRFTFVPGVAGVWEFVDPISGATGTLIAE